MLVPAPLKKHFSIIQACNIDLKALFAIPTTPPREKWIRSYVSPIAARLPSEMRYELTSIMKKMRNPGQVLKLLYPLDFAENQMIVERIEDLDLRPWWGEKAVVCVFHDVDNKYGAEFVHQMSEYNLDHRVLSTFNFLTHADYAIDDQLLTRLEQEGFEIGLHGTDHDQGFAFRKPGKIRSELSKALERLDDFDVCGYRSPALSLSQNLFYAVNDQGLTYDSSLQIASPFYHSVRLPYPVYLEEFGLWELPLVIQDDNYFRDTQTSVEEIFTSLNRFVDEVKQLNGVLTINMHPHLMRDQTTFYRQFLKWLADQEDVAIKTAKEVMDYIQASHPVTLQE